jgi:hypothetical protein
MVWAYASTTSCRPGELLNFRLRDIAGSAIRVQIEDVVSSQPVYSEPVRADSGTETEWDLRIREDWPSSLYRAIFSTQENASDEVYFAIRERAETQSRILLSVPFATWQAYNQAGIPGESIYWTESPSRTGVITFDRPGGGPPPEEWEFPLMRWLRGEGITVDYCSNIDIHLDPQSLDGYQLLVINGHDEYWTWEMRDAVESFTKRGGNVAIFGANTAWWQMRLADSGRTMICYRDALADPVLEQGHPELVTVEWSSAPVNRPENHMTGLSFRLGAGCWVPDMRAMYEAEYTVRFADHWVFEGTGLADDDHFARGALGYETDAADIDQSAGAPRVTGRDGTPGSFTVLATADLRHWEAYGQGGSATMGIFTAGRGTVFNAGTVNWGRGLDNPVVSRITHNVVSRLSRPPKKQPEWLAAGTREQVHALAGGGNLLWAAVGPPGREFLARREACTQNLPWRQTVPFPGAVALAFPRDAVENAPRGLYAACRDGGLLYRAAADDHGRWQPLGQAPVSPRALAAAADRLFLVGSDASLWSCSLTAVAEADPPWKQEPTMPVPAIGLTSLNGRLVMLGSDGKLYERLPRPDVTWRLWRDADGCTVIAGHAGSLYGKAPDMPLRRTDPWLS